MGLPIIFSINIRFPFDSSATLQPQDESTIDVGWLVRIIGLEKATELNGQVGSVKGFLIQRQRYLVRIGQMPCRWSIFFWPC